MEDDGAIKHSGSVLSRRNILRCFGAVSCIPIAGCTYVPSVGTSTEDTVEVLVDNASGEPVGVAVLVTDDDDEALFSHAFSLETDQLGRAGNIEQKPATITAFTSTGISKSWEYNPHSSQNSDSNIEDVGMTVTQEREISEWYG